MKGKRLDGAQIQSSVYGAVIPIGWGTNRVSLNLIDLEDFHATAHKDKAGGKGGSATITSYTYDAAVLMAIGKGPILGTPTIYRDKSIFKDGGTTALAQAGLSLALGSFAQSPWSYMTTHHPDRALGYSEMAYFYAAAYPLGDSGGLNNHSAEVQWTEHVTGLPDANPANVLTDVLNNVVPGWGSGLIGDLTNYSNYCLASNLLVSPVIDAQIQAAQFITDLMLASNSDCLWSEGVLKVVPYGDTEVTANGVTWTPSLDPEYDLTDDDFTAGDAPVSQELVDQSDAYNIVQIEFLNRSNAYNVETVTAQDLANIEEFGKRKQDPLTIHMIADPAIARNVVQLHLQRVLYVRGIYHFELPWDFALLEPMDLVTISTPAPQSLDRVLVRLIQIDDEDAESGMGRQCQAEPMLVGNAHAPIYGSQAGGGYNPNYDADPGDVEPPLIFNPPSVLTSDGRQTWAAVAGLGDNWGGCFVWTSVNGTDYEEIGSIEGRSRFGIITNDLAITGDPDSSSMLGVDLSDSLGDLDTASTDTADALGTLFLLGTELMAYATATLAAANQYVLSYLRRGALGTAIAAHATNDSFVRLDDRLFKFPYMSSVDGTTLYVKFQSFNIYNRALRDLADCTAYTIVPSSVAPPVPRATDWTIAGTTFTSGGYSIPALVVSGANTDPNATGLHLYFRVSGAANWTSAGLYGYTSTRMEIAGVTSATEYEGGMAKIVGGVEGEILSIGTATVGTVAVPAGPPPSGAVLELNDSPGDYDFTIPAGVTSITFERWGSGGGGGGQTNVGTDKAPDYVPNYGGGGGEYVLDVVSVSPGDVISYHVGGPLVGAGGRDTSVSAPGGLATAHHGGDGSAFAAGAGGTGAGSGTHHDGTAGGGSNSWDGGGTYAGGGDQTSPDSPPTTPGGGAPGGTVTDGAAGRVKITVT